jgi:hypothetical protein
MNGYNPCQDATNQAKQCQRAVCNVHSIGRLS